MAVTGQPSADDIAAIGSPFAATMLQSFTPGSIPATDLAVAMKDAPEDVRH